MKKLISLFLAFVLSLSVHSVTYAEATADDVVAALEMAFSDGFDYCNIRYKPEESSLFIDVAIDGFAENMYEAKENGVDSTDEIWNQIKGMFLAIYYGTVAFFETVEIETPDHILLQLWNDDVVIRDNHSTGKSRVLLAIQNGYFYIDEMEAY